MDWTAKIIFEGGYLARFTTGEAFNNGVNSLHLACGGSSVQKHISLHSAKTIVYMMETAEIIV
jgi:hypothetical protein